MVIIQTIGVFTSRDEQKRKRTVRKDVVERPHTERNILLSKSLLRTVWNLLPVAMDTSVDTVRVFFFIMKSLVVGL